MERLKIPMLSRFDAISHIMPYYGQTHRAFLLLSGLCSETRSKLDEFYDEFITCMKEYCMYVKADKWNNCSHFFPIDLFGIEIDCCISDSIHILIKFIENLRDFKGLYFNNHYMHSKIKILDSIRINFADIKELYAYVDLLRSTQVILCKNDTYNSQVQFESSTLDTNCNHILLI